MADYLSAGDNLQALYDDGNFYPAQVVAVSAGKKRAKAPVQVSFKGFPGSETWLPLASLKSKKIPKSAQAAPAAKGKAAAKAEPKGKAAAVEFDYSGLEKGMRIQAELDGVFYAADVVTVAKAKAKAKAPVKVHFAGYDASYDEWVSGARIRSKALGKSKAADPKPSAKVAAGGGGGYDYSGLEKGMRIQAELAGVWYAAEVVTVTKAKAKGKAPVKIHFAGYGADSDEWVDGDRIRSKALKKDASGAAPAAKAGKAAAAAPAAKYDYSGLEKGMRIQADLEGTWYAADVVTVAKAKAKAKAPVKVHYAGYDASYDEWVNGDRIRSKGLKKLK